jgi:hypothetical protein
MTDEKPKRKPGRRTKEEELREFAQTAGVDMQKVADFIGGALEPEEVPSAQEIRDRLLSALSNRLGELKGIALVQALKAITALAAIEEAEQQDSSEDDERRPLLDRLDALPPDHAAKLVKQEIERVDGYRQDLFQALQKLEAA